MANNGQGTTGQQTGPVQQAGAAPVPTGFVEDIPGGLGPQAAPAPRVSKAIYRGIRRPAETKLATGEVAGEAPQPVPTVRPMEAEPTLHQEVASPQGTEAGEYAEATPTQLESAGAESAAETALSDLVGLGFEAREAAAVDGGAPTQAPLREAGSALEGAEQGAEREFLPILAALAPTLISTIGPAVAQGVMSRLSPHATRVIKRLPIPPRPPSTAPTRIAPPATSSLLGLLARLLQQAQAKPGGEAGVEVDETFVEEAAAAIEVIIDKDDRVPITQTTLLPWRRLCALRITFDKATYRGTGFLIGPRAVATAGHCVYLHNQGGWARRIEVIPGCNGTSRPMGQVEATSFRSVDGWVTGKRPESDYGCVVLPAGAFGGRDLGRFGFAAFDTATLLAQPAVMAGYPGDKPFAEMWGMARVIKTITDNTLVYDIDSMGGQSGAPVYIKRNNERYVVGIHNYGALTGNSATRVTEPVYQRLLSWSKL